MQFKQITSDEFHVTMSRAELDAVRAVCGRVAGSPEQAHRRATSDFYFGASDVLGDRDDITMFRGYLEAQVPSNNR